VSGKQGVVLLSVVIILLTIALIGASLVAFFSSVNIGVQAVADDAKALYLAEAGIAYAVHTLRSQAGAGAGGEMGEIIGPVTLGEGAFTVKIDLTQSLITSTGDVKGAKKTIQLQYSAL